MYNILITLANKLIHIGKATTKKESCIQTEDMSVQLPTDYYIKQRKGTDLMLDRYTDKFMYIKLKPSVGKHWPVSLSMDVPFSL